MTNLLLASAVLAASLAADPAPAAKKEAPATAAAPSTGAPGTPPTPAKPKASAAAIADAKATLLGPCSPEMATAKVSAVELLDGNQVNKLREKEKSAKAKVDPSQRFIAVTYAAGGTKGKSLRQVSTVHMLTTEQAQALVGEKLCVFAE